jgi:hypothetical protein
VASNQKAAELVLSFRLNLLKLLLLGRFARLWGEKPAGEPFGLLGETDPIVGDFQECLPDERIGRLGRALARFDAATPVSLRLREHLDRPSPASVEGNTFGPGTFQSWELIPVEMIHSLL